MLSPQPPVADLIARFKGTAVDLLKLPYFEKWALTFFHDEQYVASPYVEITLQFDISAAETMYQRHFQSTLGASLTGYLYYQLIETLKRHPVFNYRRIADQWYHFANLPLFFPVAIGGLERFWDVLIEDVCQMDWPAFSTAYQAAITNARQQKGPFNPIGEEVWELAILIGNLPYLQFTAFTIHKSRRKTGRPLFYFGQRYKAAERLLIPLYVMLDHSTADPFVLNRLLSDYQQALTSK